MNKPKRVLLALDVENIFWSKEAGTRLDYSALLDFAKQKGRVVQANAYGVRRNGNTDAGFLLALKRMGFNKVIARSLRQLPDGSLKSDIDTILVMHVWQAACNHQADEVVLVSGDSDFLPLVEHLDGLNIATTIIGPKGHTAWELEIAATQFINTDEVPGLVKRELSVINS